MPLYDFQCQNEHVMENFVPSYVEARITVYWCTECGSPLTYEQFNSNERKVIATFIDNLDLVAKEQYGREWRSVGPAAQQWAIQETMKRFYQGGIPGQPQRPTATPSPTATPTKERSTATPTRTPTPDAYRDIYGARTPTPAGVP